MLGGNIGIAAFFKKNEMVKEEDIIRITLFAEKRAPHTGQVLALNLSQHTKQFLAHPPEDSFLCDLEPGNSLAVFQSPLLAHALIAFQSCPASFERFRVLRV